MNKCVFNVVATCAILMIGTATAVAQRDSVYTAASGGGNNVLRGRVVGTTAFKVSVETDKGRKDVPSNEVTKIVFSDEPRNLARAREQYDSNRFKDCLDSLKKIQKTPDSKYLRQEVGFLEAFSSGKQALAGDASLSTTAAEQIVGKFVRENSDSFRLVRAVDLYAQLLMSNGKFPQAQKEFGKLTNSRWPEFENRGQYYLGESQVHQGNLAAARQSFQKLATAATDNAQDVQFKKLAQCKLAKLGAMEGNSDASIKLLEKMIREESSENNQLFAVAYNALGTSYLQSNDIKKACRAFLHTQLLFSTEPEAHAEALYNLAKIWPQLKETEKANQARSLLTSRYGNSVWAAKL